MSHQQQHCNGRTFVVAVDESPRALEGAKWVVAALSRPGDRVELVAVTPPPAMAVSPPVPMATAGAVTGEAGGTQAVARRCTGMRVLSRPKISPTHAPSTHPLRTSFAAITTNWELQRKADEQRARKLLEETAAALRGEGPVRGPAAARRGRRRCPPRRCHCHRPRPALPAPLTQLPPVPPRRQLPHRLCASTSCRLRVAPAGWRNPSWRWPRRSSRTSSCWAGKRGLWCREGVAGGLLPGLRAGTVMQRRRCLRRRRSPPSACGAQLPKPVSRPLPPPPPSSRGMGAIKRTLMSVVGLGSVSDYCVHNAPW